MLRRTVLIGLAGLAAGGPLLGGCAAGGKGSAAKPAGEHGDIATEVKRMKELQRLAEYIHLAGLEDDLAGPGPFTLFAPDNNAFGTAAAAGGGLSGGGRLNLHWLRQPQNKPKLVRLIKHHVVAGRLDALAVQRSKTLKTLAGTVLKVERPGQRVAIGTAELKRTNLGASNGYIHIINEVLMPPSL